MPGFRFGLSTVLLVRQRCLEQRQIELADAVARLRQVASEKAAIEERIRQHRQRCRAVVVPGRLDVAALRAASQFEAAQTEHVAALDSQHRQLSAEIEHLRDAVVDADRQLRAIEKLREQRYREHLADQRRAEQRQLDESALRNGASAG